MKKIFYLIVFIISITLTKAQHPARPFNSSSPFNCPIPPNPVIDTNKAMVKMINASNAPNNTPQISLYEYSTPIYYVNGNSERHISVTCTEPWGVDELTTVPGGVPIPAGAKGAVGDDAHMVIWDTLNNISYDFWQYRYPNNTAAEGTTSWGGYVSTAGNGVDDPDTAGLGAKIFGATGSNICRLAGIIRLDEIKAGVIPHALVGPTDNSCSTFRWPALKSDGWSSRADCIPEGARMQLDPSIDLNTVTGMRPIDKMIAKALQVYGWYNIDNGGPHTNGLYTKWYIQFEVDPTATGPNCPAWGGTGKEPGATYCDAGFGGDYDMLQGTCQDGSSLFSHIRVLADAQVTCTAQPVRGLYVDGFNYILGNTNKEDSLLNYAKYNGFNYLALYDLWPIHVTYDLTNASSCVVLADFIQRAKQNFGILQVGAIGENLNFFQVISTYNSQHSNPLQRFDVYNVEFEFWNTTVNPGQYYCTTYLQPGGYSCDTAGGFQFYKKLIFQMDSLAKHDGVISETYVGWFNQGQAITIANTVDRILLHDYISNYSSLYSYVKQRLQFIAARNVVTNVIPIFSAEASFMGPWLSTHDVLTPYNDLQADLAGETGSWKQYISLEGYQWFTYSLMPYHVTTTGVPMMDKTIAVIYPNPSSKNLVIRTTGGAPTRVTLVNSAGEKVSVCRVQNNSDLSLDISQLPDGVYFCHIQYGDFEAVKKIIILN